MPTWKDAIDQQPLWAAIENVKPSSDCRSCLAALADQSPFETSVVYERLLILLDAIHDADVAALEPINADAGELWTRLVVGLDRLSRLRRETTLCNCYSWFR